MKEKYKKRQIAKISIFIASIFVILFSVTYAFITQTLTGAKEVVISAGVLDLVLEEENAITISNALPMYDEVGMIQDEVFVFRLVNNTSNPTNYVLKMTKIAVDNELQPSDVKYYLTKEGVGDAKLLSNLPGDGTVDSGTIAGNDTIDYTLRLWIDSEVTTNEVIAGKTLNYRIDVEVGQEIEQDPSTISVKPFLQENIDSFCSITNDGVDTFLTGDCKRNYVWYSGKLWRVVLKNNESGATKLVMEKGATMISYNTAANSNFENSYVDQWLSQEFLPTLYDTDKFLVKNSQWYVGEDSSDTPSRPTTNTIARTIGMINAYEYYTTKSSSSYLDNSKWWWLITPSSPSEIRMVDYKNAILKSSSIGFGEVRPAINLKSEIRIESGTGRINDPYMLEGDIEVPVNGTTLLNTRYIGEYITFNDELYRIAAVENNLTKIVAVDKPSTFSSTKFHTAIKVTSFADASIKTDLESYYQEMQILNEDSYNMIEPNTTWYLGSMGDGVSYKATICATVDQNVSMNDCTSKVASTTANIGLPRIGEMFTNSISRKERTSFWTITPYDSSTIHFVDTTGYIYKDYSTGVYGARPSMYLKSNVVIASNNTGNGTYEYPYSVEQ